MNENFDENGTGGIAYCSNLDKYDFCKCPKCGGDVTDNSFEYEVYGAPDWDEIAFNRECEHCGFKWTEVFRLDRVFYHTDDN